jgi:hypothetical protein
MNGEECFDVSGALRFTAEAWSGGQSRAHLGRRFPQQLVELWPTEGKNKEKNIKRESDGAFLPFFSLFAYNTIGL